jgi:hypothetical protein
MSESDNKIVLSVPKVEEEVSKGAKEFVERLDVSIEQLELWFKKFTIDSIELHISGVAEAGPITKLIVNAKAEGGIKVILKPKEPKDKIIRIA